MTAQTVNIVSLSEYIDEEVSISNGTCTITCFSSNHPPLRTGDKSMISLYLVLLSDQEVEELDNHSVDEIVREGDGYSYRIAGTLHGSLLSSLGYDFEIGSLESEYAYLDGTKIALNVDRIGVDFVNS